MRKSQLIENLENTYCRLKPSPIHGVGVFAVRNIPDRINPFAGVKNQKWYRLNNSELESLEKEVLNMIGDFFVESNNCVWVSEYGLNGMDMSAYVNHSDNPNLETIDDGITFITSREVKKGEELTIDYKTYDANWKNR